MKKLILIIMAIAVVLMLTGCTEEFKRELKTVQSDWTGGLNRTVTVYSETGTPIKSWSGKFDVSDSETEVWFDVNGKRVIIHGGIVINEEE